MIAPATNSNHRPDTVVARKDIVGKIGWKLVPSEDIKRVWRQVDANRKTSLNGITK